MSAAASLREILLAPGTFLPRAAERRFFWPAMAIAMVAAIAFSVAAVPRVDFEKAVMDALDARGGAAQMTPNELEGALSTARRVGALASYGGSVVGPWLSALVAGVALWLGFKVAGGRPGFPGSFTVAAWGLVPGSLRALLSIPAVLARTRIAPEALDRLLPSSLGAFLPAGATGPLAALLWSVDLFSLWAVVLVSVGMAGVAQVSRRRSATTVVVLWLSYVAVFKVALPALGGAR
jgi:hypothetical protein